MWIGTYFRSISAKLGKFTRMKPGCTEFSFGSNIQNGTGINIMGILTASLSSFMRVFSGTEIEFTTGPILFPRLLALEVIKWMKWFRIPM